MQLSLCLKEVVGGSGGFCGIKNGRYYLSIYDLVEPGFHGFTRCSEDEKNAVKHTVLKSCN